MGTAVILVIHVFLAASIVGLVLLQRGKGADAGAGFGSGASGTVFGARGSATVLSKATAIIATLFFVTSLSLAYLAGHSSGGGSGSLIERAQGLDEAVPAAAPQPDGFSVPTPVEDQPAGSGSNDSAGQPPPAGGAQEKSGGAAGEGGAH